MRYGQDAIAEEMQIEAWKEVMVEVEKNDGITTVTMERLREAHGTKKLGVHVLSEISDTLTGMGVGHVPEQLPSYQDELVRLYKKATPVGNLIDTVLKPGTMNDFNLRRLVGGRVARRGLRRPVVRAKACE